MPSHNREVSPSLVNKKKVLQNLIMGTLEASNRLKQSNLNLEDWIDETYFSISILAQDCLRSRTVNDTHNIVPVTD